MERYYGPSGSGALRLAQHTAEILTSSSPVTYQRGAQRDLTTPAEAYTVVEAIFGLMPSIRELKLSWLQRVRCRGAMYEAGCTWLSAALEGRQVYAFISSQGMLEWPAGSGKVWLFLEVYPAQGRDEYGLPVLEIKSNCVPDGRFVKLPSDKLGNVMPMSVSRRQTLQDDSVALRFAPLL